MKDIFGRLENKFILQKLRAFSKIKCTARNVIVGRVRSRVVNVLEKFGHLMEVKQYNHKITAFYTILDTGTRSKKLKKYQ